MHQVSQLTPAPRAPRWLLAARLALLPLCALLAAPALADVAAGPKPQTYQSFADLRNDVLNAIGGATKRIWLTTDYLTDGEIVSQLYVAQYRKLDVQVLLGRAKANFYMSRLNYLKNQNIPVFLRPDSFKVGHASALLTDDRLYFIDGELDFMAKYRHFTLEMASPEETEHFASAFAAAANLKVPALPRPIPMVGKSGGRGHVYSPDQVSGGAVGAVAGQLPRQTTHYSSGEGGYVYGGRSPPRPENVPAKLPKALKWKMLQEQQIQQAREAERRKDKPAAPDAELDKALPAPDELRAVPAAPPELKPAAPGGAAAPGAPSTQPALPADDDPKDGG